MGLIRGYSELLKTIKDIPSLKNGVMLDTNVLIAATYDLDNANTEALALLDLLYEFSIPKFCNVNVRFEFLEVHRRIIFTEALLNFNTAQIMSSLSPDLIKKFHSLKTRAAKANKSGLAMRLSENEIKQFKLLLHKYEISGRNAWLVFCECHIGSQLVSLWHDMERNLGINFLSLRHEDNGIYMENSPQWDDVTLLMGKYGLSSSDAMIINIFLCSKFKGLISSDIDVALSFSMMPNTENRILFIPDHLIRVLSKK